MTFEYPVPDQFSCDVAARIYGQIDQVCVEAEQTYGPLRDGRTALFWELVSVIVKHTAGSDDG